MKTELLNLIRLNQLIPTIIQDSNTKDVLMLGYMNKKALAKTTKSGWVYFWSRSRNRLWMKGEESGNKLKVKKIFIDCDKDTLLILVDLLGKYACHQQSKSCFSCDLQEVSS